MINYENRLCPDTDDLKASGPCHSSVPFKKTINSLTLRHMKIVFVQINLNYKMIINISLNVYITHFGDEYR